MNPAGWDGEKSNSAEWERVVTYCTCRVFGSNWSHSYKCTHRSARESTAGGRFDKIQLCLPVVFIIINIIYILVQNVKVRVRRNVKYVYLYFEFRAGTEKRTMSKQRVFCSSSVNTFSCKGAPTFTWKSTIFRQLISNCCV